MCMVYMCMCVCICDFGFDEDIVVPAVKVMPKNGLKSQILQVGVLLFVCLQIGGVCC